MTLLTGDRFHVVLDERGGQQVSRLPGGGPAGGTFSQFTLGGDTYVVPSEAVPYLGRTIDLRLFNVGYLVRAKLDDERSATLPITVRAGRAQAEALPATSVTAAAGDAATATVTKKDAPALGRLLAETWRGAKGDAVGTLPGVERIELAVPEGAPEPPRSPLAADAPATRAAGDELRYHMLTVDSIDRDGTPGTMIGAVQNVSDGALATFAFAYPGEEQKSFMVPEGTYSIMASVLTAPGTDLTSHTALVIQPEVRVSADTSVVLDARKAVRYRPTLASPPRAPLIRSDSLSFVRTSAAGDETGISPSNLLAGFLWKTYSDPVTGSPDLYVTPTRRVRTGGFTFTGFTLLAENAESGPQMGATYKLVFAYGDAVPARMTQAVRKPQLAAVRSTLHNTASDAASPGPVIRASYVFLPWGWSDVGHGYAPSTGERVDYVYSSRPDETYWQHAMGTDTMEFLYGVRRKLRPGQEVSETWNLGPRTPSAAATYAQETFFGLSGPGSTVDKPWLQVCLACRQGLLGSVYLSGYADSAPLHSASEAYAASRTTFYRDGKIAFDLGAGGYAPYRPVPLSLPLAPRPADYRLVWDFASQANAQSPSRTEWTFRSGPRDATAALPRTVQCADPARRCSFLPLLFVHWDLKLDLDSRAEAGQAFDVGFRVSHQEHQARPTGVRATVEVSYDDGRSWSAPQTATARRDGTFAAPITHPAYSDAVRWVSLRVKARAGDGSTVTQTNIRAYRLAG
uniref:Peptidase S8 and S53, subtilisin, kexin, sedolisin n=1 Tax=Nonomuraea gerenzanensis TaxID=93944 RepID=A0A1M4E9U9_9ACTN|nr:peptidase S8 and S53, subtilisin, kexin, sedolisin [Nonomuraea gerenzanensis]